ncbi:MAG TPA: nucleoside phosphorylase [Desulfobacterales bacterium]|nr:nucleoside phosphorylase [Desulfobacterales bacterium]
MSCQASQSRNDQIVSPVKGKNSPDLGPVAVMVSSQSDLSLFCSLTDLDEKKYRNLFISRLYAGNNAEKEFTLVGPFVGAPYAAMLLETLIAWGVEKIIFFGWCGAISHDVKIGDIIIPNGAIIDEGTSKHYHQGNNAVSRPSSYILKNTKEALTKAGLAFHEGIVWSTDAIYRETSKKVKYYQGKDVLAVEMELSALFTVGKFRNVQMGGILVVSDELSTLTWQPGFREQRFKESRKTVVEVIKEIILS